MVNHARCISCQNCKPWTSAALSNYVSSQRTPQRATPRRPKPTHPPAPCSASVVKDPPGPVNAVGGLSVRRHVEPPANRVPGDTSSPRCEPGPNRLQDGLRTRPAKPPLRCAVSRHGQGVAADTHATIAARR